MQLFTSDLTHKVWFYWLLTIPLTVVVVSIWLFWNWWAARHPRHRQNEIYSAQDADEESV